MKNVPYKNLAKIIAHKLWKELFGDCVNPRKQNIFKIKGTIQALFLSRGFKADTSLSLWHILFYAKQNPKRPY